MDKKYFCLCCGYNTLPEPPPGTFHICEICFWEDDNTDGGANKVTLKEAKENFKKFGASELKFKKQVRPPNKNDKRIDEQSKF